MNINFAYAEKNSNIEIKKSSPWLISILINKALNKILGHNKFYQTRSEIIAHLRTAKQITLSEKGLYQAPTKSFFKEYATQDENSLVITVPARIKHLQDSSFWYQEFDQYSFRLQQERYRWFKQFLHVSFTHPLGYAQKSIDFIFSDYYKASIIKALAIIIALVGGIVTYGILTVLCAIGLRYYFNYKTEQYTKILTQIKALPSITRQEQFLLFVKTLADVCPQAVSFGIDGRLKASSECSLETIALEFFDLTLEPEQLTKEYLLQK